MKFYYLLSDECHSGIVVWENKTLMSLNECIQIPSISNVSEPIAFLKRFIPRYTVKEVSEEEALVIQNKSDELYEEAGRQNELSDKGLI